MFRSKPALSRMGRQLWAILTKKSSRRLKCCSATRRHHHNAVLMSRPLAGLAAQLCEELARLAVSVIDGGLTVFRSWMRRSVVRDIRYSVAVVVGVWQTSG